MRIIFTQCAAGTLLSFLLFCSPLPAQADSLPPAMPMANATSSIAASVPQADAAGNVPFSNSTSNGDALSAAVVVGAVAAKATSGVNSGRHDGWISLEPGSRPAYVGIQGGTAPLTLLRSPGGALFGYTGATGNDFMHILRGKSLTEDPSLPKGSKEVLQVPGVETPRAPGLENADAPAVERSSMAAGPMQPFGLSNPEQVLLLVQEEAPPPPQAPKAKSKKPRPRHKRLKLGSYMSILSDKGNL